MQRHTVMSKTTTKKTTTKTTTTTTSGEESRVQVERTSSREGHVVDVVRAHADPPGADPAHPLLCAVLLREERVDHRTRVLCDGA